MKTNSAWLEFNHLIRSARKGRLALLLAVMTSVGLTEGFGIVMLVPLLQSLDGAAGSKTSAHSWLGLQPLSLGWILLLVTALTVLRSGLQYCQSTLSVKVQQDLVDDLRLRCFGGLLHAEWRWLAEKRSADHASLLLTNIGRIGAGLNQTLALGSAAVSLVACLGAALILSWKMALFTAMAGAVTVILFGRKRRHALQLGEQLSVANRTLHSHIQDGLAGIRLTKILRNEVRQLSNFAGVLRMLRGQHGAFVSSQARSRAALQVSGAATLALSVYAGVTWWHLSHVSLLPLVFVFSRMVPILGSVQQSYHYWLHAVPALAETRQLLVDTGRVAEPKLSAESEPLPLIEALVLDSVSFTYGGRSRPALDALTFQIEARSTTAIVGSSGAGKSTLADVLMGLIAPDCGRVMVDGVSITGEFRPRWRSSVAYVQQDVFLFNDTIRANLLWSQPCASETDINNALTTSSAEFVHFLPNGLDTVVGDRGVRLSGGERQRIALARALLGTPSLLILDEATSALDHANESAIRSAITNLHGNMTIIIIGHRLALLDQADQVIELQNGRIIQNATIGKPA